LCANRPFLILFDQDRVAEFARGDVPSEFMQRLTVVTFPQLGFLIEINMNDSDLPKVPLEFQVRA
jgi:hypothetical protein